MNYEVIMIFIMIIKSL